jgi:hypothetical protein
VYLGWAADHKDQFNEAVTAICDLYRLAPERFADGSHTVCLDENTGIQALERIHLDKPVRPGEAAKLEFEYRRHGTQALIPSFEVSTGRIIHAGIGPTRSEEDFARVVEATVDTDPDAEWKFICDRLNTSTRQWPGLSTGRIKVRLSASEES